jgi:hypothetical protein
VVRSIFKKVWGTRDRGVILNVVGKVPENVVKDARLLTCYDQTLVRTKTDQLPPVISGRRKKAR